MHGSHSEHINNVETLTNALQLEGVNILQDFFFHSESLYMLIFNRLTNIRIIRVY